METKIESREDKAFPFFDENHCQLCGDEFAPGEIYSEIDATQEFPEPKPFKINVHNGCLKRELTH